MRGKKKTKLKLVCLGQGQMSQIYIEGTRVTIWKFLNSCHPTLPRKLALGLLLSAATVHVFPRHLSGVNNFAPSPFGTSSWRSKKSQNFIKSDFKVSLMYFFPQLSSKGGLLTALTLKLTSCFTGEPLLTCTSFHESAQATYLFHSQISAC